MPEATGAMTVRDAVPPVRIIDIVGEVTACAELVLAEAFGQESAGDTKVVVCNFAGMEYMNSSGIGILVTTRIRANRKHQQMRAFGLSQHSRKILSLTRLDEASEVAGA